LPVQKYRKALSGSLSLSLSLCVCVSVCVCVCLCVCIVDTVACLLIGTRPKCIGAGSGSGGVEEEFICINDTIGGPKAPAEEEVYSYSMIL